ncbi:MAG: hypothetical protein R6U96_06310, partial [Promethearchaeia archaeon]
FEENLINPPDIIGEINVNNLMGISTIFLDNIGKDDITFILTSKNRETDNKDISIESKTESIIKISKKHISYITPPFKEIKYEKIIDNLSGNSKIR